jgi:hypothetical protein
VEEVVAHGTGGAGRWRVSAKVLQFFLDALEGHLCTNVKGERDCINQKQKNNEKNNKNKKKKQVNKTERKQK